MNPVVAQLTMRNLLGGRRKLLLIALAAVLLALTIVARLLLGGDDAPDLAEALLGVFALGTLLPLLALIAGTGAIGPEIDDGSIMYLLAKPVRRSAIILAKLVVAIGVVLVFGALPVCVSGLILTGSLGGPTLAFTVAAAVAGIAYSAVFLLLGVVSRNAVVIGLLYAVVWEALVGQLVSGAQAISIQQWALAATEWIFEDAAYEADIVAAVGGVTGVALLLVVTIGSTWLATHRLRSLRIGSDDG